MTTHHTEEYKKEAVRLVIKNNRRIKLVATELGINHWTLKDWVEKHGKQIQVELVDQGMTISPEEENRRLKKELADVTEERDILKKAIAVFSKQPKTNIRL